MNNIPALVRIMAWCWPGNKPLSEPMVVRLLTHMCVTRPRWVTGLVTVLSVGMCCCQIMMTPSNGSIFRVTSPLCGEFTGPGDFPTQRPVTRSFDVFFDLRLNKGLSKQPWGWWFETPSWSLWRQCNLAECTKTTIHICCVQCLLIN